MAVMKKFEALLSAAFNTVKIGKGTSRMGKHISFGHSRKMVKQIAVVMSMLLVAFGSVTAIAATSGNITITTSNATPPLDIETQKEAADAGVVGDTIVLTAKPTTGSIAGPLTSTGLTVTFAAAGATTVAATNVVIGSQTTVVDTITVTIPAGAVTGALTVTDGAGHQGIVTPYAIWSSHTEPYTMPTGHLNVTYGDVKYILDQVKFGEAHAARTSNATSVVTAATNAASGAAAGLLSYSSGRTAGLYPYDVISATRCLQPSDLTTAATAAYGPTGLSNGYTYSNLDPWGIRQVDGECNNITNVTAEAPTASQWNTVPNKADTAGWGASDQFFTRLSTATNKPGVAAPYTLNAVQKAYSNPTSYVKDASPRLISNLIADQSSNNPAAVSASSDAFNTLYGTSPNAEVSVNATSGNASTSMQIPNITADYNVSAGYNSWFTLFGQFFDHGLDLIPKAGSQVFIPLDQSDPLYVNSPTAKNYMQLTRGSDSTGEQINITSPYVDQSQTYGSVASQNAWLREYAFTGVGSAPVPTGKMLEGSDFTARGSGAATSPYDVNATAPLNGGLATWWDLKHQAARMGFHLSDYDAKSIPILATNQYGKFIAGAHGFPMMLFKNASNQYKWIEGNPANQVWTYPSTAAGGAAGAIGGNGTGSMGWAIAGALNGFTAVSTGHNFINDTMSSAVPNDGAGAMLQPDADIVIEAPGSSAAGYYDDEALNEHFVAGDGRVNENIGLSAVHNTFHSEHNTLVNDLKAMLVGNPVITDAFLGEFTTAKTATASRDINAITWDGERLYQVARYIDEMEYQHMVYDEFVRRISPGLPVFVAYQPTTRPDITQEFASAVYRLGHSMLNETIARSNPGTVWDPNNNQDVSLVTAFTNPSQARLPRPVIVASAVANTSSSITYTVASGETVPENGSVVSISGLGNSSSGNTMNIRNGFVSNASQLAGTFRIATYFNGTSASAVSVAVTSGATASSRTYSPAANDPNYVAGWTTKDSSSYLARATISSPGVSGYTYTPGQSAAAIAQGMSQQRGNEIDEFTTDAVRNNLLGAPLDLPSLNMTRGRDTGVPTLNQFRSTTGGALKPYKSWNDFVMALRYPASAVNFVAAYGTDASITTKTVTTVTKAVSSPTSYTFTVADTSGLRASTDVAKTNGSVVSISGFANARLNLQNAIVDTVTSATTFTVSKYYLTSPSAPNSFVKGATVAGVDAGYTALLKDANAQPISNLANVGTVTSTITRSGNVTRDTTLAERRAAAATMMNNVDFMNSTGAWSLKETGFNNIDMWIGGLAENPAKQPLTPPMLGPTFQYVFDKQTLALQNGDRFYYLGRILGTNLNEEIPAQKLTDIVRRNSPSAGNSMISPASANKGIIGMNSPGFGVGDCLFSPDSSVPASADNSQGGVDTKCPTGTMSVDSNNALVHTGLDNVIGFGDQNANAGLPGIRIAGGAGDDSLQGTAGNDFLSGGASGGDLIDGYSGDDILFGGPGEDLMKGGAGNDVLDMGESQAGDIADGGSGADFIHNSNSTGVAASAIGEAGDDFIQGGTNNDVLLEGGEGSDWIEGNGGLDFVNGDSGPNAALVDMLNGGDDVISGGAGNDILNGDGGDDVANLGDGVDLVTLGTGFDWVNYEGTTRYDNGPAAKPGAFIELAGGAIPNPTLMPVDAVLDAEGVSGSAGNDVLIGRQAQNQVLTATPTPITAATAANLVYGKAGLSWLTIKASTTTIDGGMMVTGNGIPKGAMTVGPPALFTDATGLTTLQIVLSAPLTATVTGQVQFKVWPLQRPNSVKGLASLIAGTPGSIAAGQPGSSTLVPLTVAGEWTGGTIITGGAGNDALYAMGGSNVIHGSAQLHTCIVATTNTGAPFDQGSDVQCDGRNGYSGMTPLLTYLNNGDVSPGNLRTVRELVSTSVPVSFAVSNGAQVTYTVAKNTFAVGDLVTVTTASTNTGVSVNRAAVTAVTGTSFTVAAAATAFTGAVNGTAVQSDDLYLPGLAAQYQIERLSVLPLGATTGYKITGPVGVDFVYDVQQIIFDALAGAAPTPLVLSNVYTAATGNTGLATGASSLGLGAGVILNPPFNPAIHNYTAIANVANTTTTPVASTAGTAKFVNGLANGTTALAVTIPTTGTVTYAFGTATTNQYTVTFSAAGSVAKFDDPRSTASGFTVNITNCDKANLTYTLTALGGTATIGDQIGSSCQVVVAGLGPRQAATLQVSAVPTVGTGYTAGVGTVTGMSANGAATQIVFDTPVSVDGGFTVNILNAPAGFTYSADISGNSNWASTNVAFSGAGTTDGTGAFTTSAAGNIAITVSNMVVGESALLSITANRTGYPTSNNVVMGTAGGTIVSTPAITTTTPGSGGFNITNYNGDYNYSLTLESPSGSGDVALTVLDANTANIAVTGLSGGEAWRVTIDQTNPGTTGATKLVTYGVFATSPTPTVDVVAPALPNPTTDGFVFHITNFDGTVGNYSLTTTAGSVAITADQAGAGTATVTVTGLASNQAATVTINYSAPLSAAATPVTVSGVAQSSGAPTPVVDTLQTAAYQAVSGATTLNGFSFVVTNYDPAYTWNVSATAPLTLDHTTISGSTATFYIVGMAIDGSGTVGISTSRVGFSPSSTVSVTGSAYKTGLTVSAGTVLTKTSTAGITMNLTGYSALYTYTLAWSFTNAAGTAQAVPTGSTITVSNTGVVTITSPGRAIAVGSKVTFTITTARQNYTTVTSKFTVTM